MAWKRCAMAGILWIAGNVSMLNAQETTQVPASSGIPVSLTLKRAIELALQNSKDIQLAKTTRADRRAGRESHAFRVFAQFVRGFRRGLHLWIAGNSRWTATVAFQRDLHATCFEWTAEGIGERAAGRSQGTASDTGGNAECGDDAGCDVVSGAGESASFAWSCCKKRRRARKKLCRSRSSGKAKGTSCRWK